MAEFHLNREKGEENIKAKRISKTQEQKVLELQGTMKAKLIAERVGVTLNQVYEVFKRYKTTNKQNQEFELNEIQEQIILSGIIGDGRLKKNGKKNYYYSECHALQEFEYLQWKYKNLGNLTRFNAIYDKNIVNGQAEAKEFCTKTTPTLIKYVNMSKAQVMAQLNDLGLLLIVLDDGWRSQNSKYDRIHVAMSSAENRTNFINRCQKVLGIEPYETGIKRVDVTISTKDCKKLLEVINKYNMFSLDVVSKKFLTLKKLYNY